ncbi:MAG: hypothetical protein LBO20_11435, partial [Bifidobacteriaceae bacterium]|nr:hypothetical protein [Bifidobacteriaceae bacterium]
MSPVDDAVRSPSASPSPGGEVGQDVPVEEAATQELLVQLRHSIDNIDAAVVHLLAERFKFTQA